MTSMLRIGAIGNRNHAAKVISQVNKSGIACVTRTYHPTKHLDVEGATCSLEDLFDCDAILILSPDHTHFEYLSTLAKNYGGYIFCEKPPVTSLTEQDSLQLDPHRTFFNFNLRFSRLSDFISTEMDSGRLGKPVHVHVSSCHGLSFTEGYAQSWRGAGERGGGSVVETKSIHFLDLFSFLFGVPESLDVSAYCHSGQGAVDDTATISLTFSKGVTGTIFSSYATPLHDEIHVYGTNGTCTYVQNELRYSGPRETFDHAGRFAFPPEELVHKFTPSKTMWNEALERSVLYFLEAVREGSELPSILCETSLATNRLLLTRLNPHSA